MQQAVQQHLNQLTRDEIVAILQTHGGYRCYDEEGTEYLRDVLRSDIDNGVLPETVLLAAPDRSAAARPAH
jgi:flagellar basal body-associated protein FliL